MEGRTSCVLRNRVCTTPLHLNINMQGQKWPHHVSFEQDLPRTGAPKAPAGTHQSAKLSKLQEAAGQLC